MLQQRAGLSKAKMPANFPRALFTYGQKSRACDHANLAAVGWVLRGYSEQYSGFQTVIVLYTKGNDGL